MFRPAHFYGEAHADNGKDDGPEGFYFVIEGRENPGFCAHVGGFVTREEFTWLAERLGLPPLSDETVTGDRT